MEYDITTGAVDGAKKKPYGKKAFGLDGQRYLTNDMYEHIRRQGIKF